MAPASGNHRHVDHRPCGRCLLVSIPSLLAIVAFSLFFLGRRLWDDLPAHAAFHLPLPLSSPSANISETETTSEPRSSPFSFDMETSLHPGWMAAAPDDWSLALLALPGTHDTLTHRVHSEVYRCQNGPLATQLRAGVRYLDIRARVQIPPSPSREGQDGPWPLGIYHGSAYTGYGFAEVAATVFSFLDANPSETVVLRLKEEAAPIVGSVGDPPGRRPASLPAPVYNTSSPDWWLRAGCSAQTQPSPFEASFNQYRLHDARTAPGFADHLYRFSANSSGASSSPPTRIPTVGELRGKVLLLQEFPNFKAAPSQTSDITTTYYFGIPWQLSSALLQVEDLWQIADVAHLDEKWAAIRQNLQAAGEAADDGSRPMPLYLSHLSASIGVTPIDAAAGPADGSVVGMNDRTGRWLAPSHDGADEASESSENGGQHLPPVGIVIADFPGRQLIEAVLRRNNFTRGLL